ncbi:chalcone isomerase family protein [Vibrio furnissii]|uniref:chalcone isomerase family protein n=1 Tax=Vibrio furnissii TaxID=29494 RepID=UPI002574142C|nr:chalcone isomerase family protein [Vibrio furnissii]WJG20519.1 chalcone isomerase family protein [Vibrio furnissii]
MKTSLVTAQLYLMAVLWAATANSAEVHAKSSAQWTDWPVVGQATLSWFWLDIYASQLRTPDGHYQQDSDVTPHPVALEIRYLRDISREQLLEATQDQWHKLGYDASRSEAWLDALTRMMPNVKAGERLVYVSDGVTGQMYYFTQQGKQRLLGKVADEAMNDAFLSIWLSPKTEYPKLRNQLIGMNR